MTGAISQDWESCQFPFVLDEKPTFVPGGSAGEGSGGKRKLLSPRELQEREICDESGAEIMRKL
jgi:hypothetical protein